MKTSIQTLLACVAIAALTVATDVQAQEAKPAAKAAPTKTVARAVASTKVRPLSVAVELISPTKIIGTLTDTSNLDMRTSFGTANIPLSEVAGIRFASAESASTTVVMLNGDSITGATDVKLVSVETEWGQATINGQNISSIMFVPGLAWNATTGLNGKRWGLVNVKVQQAAKTAAAPAPAASNTQTPTSSRSSSRYPNGSVPQPVYRGR